jgi:hypothetical protein
VRRRAGGAMAVLAAALAAGAVAPVGAGAALVVLRGGDPGGAGRIEVGRDDGSGRRAIARGQDPLLSPNGRLVAYTAGGRVLVADVRTRHVTALGDGRPLAWRPDGTALAVDTGMRLAVADLRGRMRGVARCGEDGCGQAVFSPDGHRLAQVSGGRLAPAALQVVDLRTGAVTRPAFSGQPVYAPIWGPPGLAVALDAASRDEASRPVVSMWDGRSRGFRALRGRLGEPVAFGIGGLLVGVPEGLRGFAPALVDPRSGATRRSFGRRAYQGVVDLRPDGKAVLVVDHGRAVQLSVRSGARRVLATRRVRFAAWSSR